jgi:hypothetical protein
MRVIYTFTGRQRRQLKEIASTLSYTNRKAFVITRSCPYSFIFRLKEYGIEATARPVVKNKKLIGYNFLKQAA